MPFTLELPDEIVAAIDLDGGDLAVEMKKDIAIGLYQRRALSTGLAARLAGMDRMDFEDLLHERHVVSPFSLEDLEHDMRVVDELIAEDTRRRSMSAPTVRED